MTEEEINKKAEKHCNEVLCNAHEKCNEVIKCRDWRSRRAGFFCGYEQALKDFEKENAELKSDNDARKFAMAMSEKVEKQLREENAELKEAIKHFNPCGEWDDDVHDCEFRHYAMEYGSKLTKAKELLERLLITSCNSDVINLLPNCSEVLRVRAEAAQFISEVEK